MADAFEDFLGSPLLSSKIEASYDVVAQLLFELCDGGMVATTEPNALRDVVEAPSLMGKLLGGVGMPAWVIFSSLVLLGPSALRHGFSSSQQIIPCTE